MNVIVLDRQLDADRHQSFACRGIDVDVVLCFPYAVRQFRNALARELFDVVLHFGERRLDRLDTVLVRQANDFLFRNARRFSLRLHVADDVERRARIRCDQPADVRKILTLAPHAGRRDAQSFGHVVERADVERSRYGAADVGPVAVRLREPEQFALVEDRADDARVVEVRAALVHIVHDEYIARVNVAGEIVDHGLRRVMQGTDMRGDIAAALHDRVAARVAQRRGKIARINNEGIAGAEDLLRHLVDDVDEGVLQNLEGDGIEGLRFDGQAHCDFSSVTGDWRHAITIAVEFSE